MAPETGAVCEKLHSTSWVNFLIDDNVLLSGLPTWSSLYNSSWASNAGASG